MKKFFLILSMALAAVCTACSDADSLGFSTENNTVNPKGRTITVTSDVEEQGGPGTRTSIDAQGNVRWCEGDSYSLMTAGDNDVLVGTVTSKSSGLGIAAPAGTYYVRYTYVNVVVNGVDVTEEVNASGTSANNAYKLGVYDGSHYVYPTPGTIIKVVVSSDNEHLPLIQSSSSSSISSTNVGVVTLKGIEYSKDQTKWTKIDSTTEMANGFSSKSAVDYKWLGGSHEQLTLVDGAGSTSATFTGQLDYEGAPHYAVYPYNEDNGATTTDIVFTLPAKQEYAEGTFASGANPAVGELKSTEGKFALAFRNVCGVLRLQLTGNDIVNSIEVRDLAGDLLCGSASVKLEDIETEAGPVAVVNGGSAVVTLNCGEVQLKADVPTTFDIVLPVGSLSEGFTAVIQTTEGSKSLTTEKDNTIVRSKMTVMPAKDLSQQEVYVPEFNVENEAVAYYLQNSKATISSTASGISSSYFTQSRSYRPDQPAVKVIEFTSETASTAQVILSTNKDMSNPELTASVALKNGKGSYTLRNFIPGNTYYYQVVDGKEVLTSGALKATGLVRMIAVDKGFNIRDLGGWTGLGGKKIAYGKLYRGGSLGGSDMNKKTSTIDDDTREELHRLGIRAQLDLRAASNAGKYTGESSLHSYSRGETTLADCDFNNTMTDYGAYNQDATLISDLAWIIYELKQGKPLYFNCRQGADRTGAVAYVIEGLLGCYGSDKGHQMAMDYELTGFSQANLVDNVATGSSRTATEMYESTSKAFRQILDLKSSDSSITLNTLQEKCYYYLNRYAKTSAATSKHTYTTNRTNKISIDKDDLDWFIKYMLGMTDAEYAEFQPSWAFSGDDLKTIAEKNANVVSYK